MVDRTTRPIVPVVHSDEVEHRRLLAMRASASLPKDGTEGMSAPLPLSGYATADLPPAAQNAGAIAYDSDEDAIVYSDGSDWIEVGLASIVTEGSWTPDLQFDGANTGITYTTQVGRWVRTGNMVQLWATIRLADQGAETGDVSIGGLPFTASTVTGLEFIGPVDRLDNIAEDGRTRCFIESGGDEIWLEDDSGQMSDVDFNDDTALSLSISYRTG